MSVLTKQQVLDEFKNATDDDLFCVYCYNQLIGIDTDNGKRLYCPNNHCDNDRQYHLDGREE